MTICHCVALQDDPKDFRLGSAFDLDRHFDLRRAGWACDLGVYYQRAQCYRDYPGQPQDIR
jgi:hypothetical protein